MCEFLVPGCGLGSDVHYNFSALKKLRYAGAEAHYMPAPATESIPYIHAKMIRVDNARVYIGSINFSYNSLAHAASWASLFLMTTF